MLRDLCIVIAIIASLASAIFFGAIAIDKNQCAAYETATGRPTKYVGLACFVKYKGDWYDGKEFNNIMRAEGTSK